MSFPKYFYHKDLDAFYRAGGAAYPLAIHSQEDEDALEPGWCENPVDAANFAREAIDAVNSLPDGSTADDAIKLLQVLEESAAKEAAIKEEARVAAMEAELLDLLAADEAANAKLAADKAEADAAIEKLLQADRDAFKASQATVAVTGDSK